VEDPEKTADILGISSVMVQDMTGKRQVNPVHDASDHNQRSAVELHTFLSIERVRRAESDLC
jgi:hypothetical protein